MLLAEVVRRAHLLTGDKILYAPLQWLGNSDHHLHFSGTLTAEPRTDESEWQELPPPGS